MTEFRTMPTVLQINTSMFIDRGESSQLATRLVDGLREQHPGTAVIERDLAADPVPQRLVDVHMGMMREYASTPEHHAELLDTLGQRVRIGLCSNFSHTATALRIMRALYPIARRLYPNIGIESADLAAAMLRVGLDGDASHQVLENREIRKWASSR